MNEDGPSDSPYGTLAKHDQSETKRDILSLVWPYSHLLWRLSLSGEMLTCHECYKIALFCGLSPPLDKSRTVVTVHDNRCD
jgi:hypothetical protein